MLTAVMMHDRKLAWLQRLQPYGPVLQSMVSLDSYVHS